MLINAKLQIGKEDQKTELTGRSPLRRLRSALDCRAMEEVEGGGGGEEEYKEEEEEEDDDDKYGALVE